MAMGPPTLVGIALTILTTVLLGILVGVWLGNYRRFRSSMVLGLLVFSAVLLIENVIAIAFFLSMGMLYSMDPLVTQVVLGMRVLELVAVGALTAVTLQ
jgi:hypothetical protein